eukprot:88285_1
MSEPTDPTTIPDIIKTYPEPEELDFDEPHIKNVYSKPTKIRGHYYLQYDCYETAEILFYEKVEFFMVDRDIHQFFRLNHYIYSTFGIYWRRTTKLSISCKKNDVVYDNEDDKLYIVDSIDDNVYVHPLQRHESRLIIGKELDINALKTRGTIKAASSTIYELLPHTIEVIANKHAPKIILKIFDMINYGKSKATVLVPLKKKLFSPLHPEKRPSIVNKYWIIIDNNFADFTERGLQKASIPYKIKNKMVTVKMRKDKFDEVFKYKNEKISERTGEIERAFIDYITLKINLRRNIFRIIGYILKEDLETGQILGEDLIPDDWTCVLD